MSNTDDNSDTSSLSSLSLSSVSQSRASNTPKKNAPGAADKYNISNVLKHIYTLKYVQRTDQPVNAAAVNSNETSLATGAIKTGTARQFWMPDDQVKECFECNDKFTMFNRRHVYTNILRIFSFQIKTIYSNTNSIVGFVDKYFAANVRTLKYQVN